MSEVNNENLKFVRLINNDELIALVEKKKTGLELTNPMRVLIDAELDMNRQTIYMHSWIPQGIAKGSNCFISSKDILFTADVEEDIAEYYHGIVFEMVEDRGKYKRIDKKKKEINVEKSKVISFPSNKNNIE